jgi:hypothetical protein
MVFRFVNIGGWRDYTVLAQSHRTSVVSTGRTTQAEGYRPGLVGPGLVRNTYTFPIRKGVVRGEERSGFFDDTWFFGTYKWVAVEALSVAPY